MFSGYYSAQFPQSLHLEPPLMQRLAQFNSTFIVKRPVSKVPLFFIEWKLPPARIHIFIQSFQAKYALHQ